MLAFGIYAVTADWTSAKWLLWIGLYLSFGLLGPWAMTRAGLIIIKAHCSRASAKSSKTVSWAWSA